MVTLSASSSVVFSTSLPLILRSFSSFVQSLSSKRRTFFICSNDFKPSIYARIWLQMFGNEDISRVVEVRVFSVDCNPFNAPPQVLFIYLVFTLGTWSIAHSLTHLPYQLSSIIRTMPSCFSRLRHHSNWILVQFGRRRVYPCSHKDCISWVWILCSRRFQRHGTQVWIISL